MYVFGAPRYRFDLSSGQRNFFSSVVSCFWYKSTINRKTAQPTKTNCGVTKETVFDILKCKRSGSCSVLSLGVGRCKTVYFILYNSTQRYWLSDWQLEQVRYQVRYCKVQNVKYISIFMAILIIELFRKLPDDENMMKGSICLQSSNKDQWIFRLSVETGKLLTTTCKRFGYANKYCVLPITNGLIANYK